MAEDVIVWKVQSRWIPVSTMTINFGKTVDVDDPIDIQLFEAEQNLGKFSINGDLASIYKTAKEKTHDGPFFGEVTTCLI